MSKINYSEKRKKDLRHQGILLSAIMLIIMTLTLIYISYSIFVLSPIKKSKAVSLTGELNRYISQDILGTSFEEGIIHLEDGTELEISEFVNDFEDLSIKDELKSLEKGTKLQFLKTPHRNYVMEIKTDSKVILSFEDYTHIMSNVSKKLAIPAVLSFAFLIYLLIKLIISLYKNIWKPDGIIDEIEKVVNPDELVESTPLRNASCEDNAKVKIRLEATDDTYRYRTTLRRIKFVNELVINDKVYAEKKCIFEDDHILSAVVDGHLIEAGIIDDSALFIMFDGKLINYNSSIFLLLN